MAKGYFYFLSNSTRSLLYAGATKNVIKRLWLHELGTASVFTKKYHIEYLIYFEEFEEIGDAFKRKKQIKNWHKDWKWNLIKEMNPELLDLRHRFE
jgi:putative endonuclease